MAKWLRRWGLCVRGQGLIEYALILSLIAVGLVSVLLLLRNSAENTYNGVGNNLGQVVVCDGSASCTAGQGVDTGSGGSTGGGNGNGNGHDGGGNGNGNNGNGNGNGGGNGSNGKGGGKGNS
jgi:Flp pilus assembly pilin Flp